MSPAAAVARLVPAVGRRRRGGWLWREGGPRIWAHRGASALATENTIPAFERAVADGADGVELDVLRCGSGEVVVFHDDDLRRLADRSGRIEALPWSELRRVELRGGTRLCLLEDALAACGDLAVNVELKSPRPGRAGRLAAAVAEVVRRTGTGDRVVVSSFDPIAIVQLHAAAPALATAFLFEAAASPRRRSPAVATLLGASAVHPEHTLCDPGYVAAWRARGFAVNVWTVDAPARLVELARAGVDGVIANDPAAARRALTPPDRAAR